MRAVVIGTGPAGLSATETLRALDPAGSVVALSSEPYPPYSPAAIVDHLVTGRDTVYWRGRDVMARLGVDERRAAPVAALDVDNREVVLADGARLAYDGLVVASGSRLYAPIEGADLAGVLDFKSLTAAERIVERVHRHQARTALIVGNGFIGVELSLMLAELGVSATIVGRRHWIMPRVLDPATSELAERELAEKGVSLRLGVEATAFVGEGEVSGVRLADGTMLRADLYVAATGVKPHVEFVGGALDTGWGLRVDDRLRANAPGVVAAGDVAEAADWLTGERFVHAILANAVAQGRLAARNLLGADEAYPGAESMNSLKHLGLPIVAMGTIADPDDVLRADREDVRRALYLRGGTIVGAQLAGDIRGAGVYRSLMLRRADVTRFGPALVEPRFTEAVVVGRSLAPAA